MPTPVETQQQNLVWTELEEHRFAAIMAADDCDRLSAIRKYRRSQRSDPSRRAELKEKFKTEDLSGLDALDYVFHNSEEPDDPSLYLIFGRGHKIVRPQSFFEVTGRLVTDDFPIPDRGASTKPVAATEKCVHCGSSNHTESSPFCSPVCAEGWKRRIHHPLDWTEYRTLAEPPKPPKSPVPEASPIVAEPKVTRRGRPTKGLAQKRAADAARSREYRNRIRRKNVTV